MSYQLIEVPSATINIDCPFCKQSVVDWSQEQYVQPCSHTLFVAMSLGFEFVADRFEDRMSLSVDELHENPEADVFAAITEVKIENMVIVKSDLGMQDMYRYSGFVAD